MQSISTIHLDQLVFVSVTISSLSSGSSGKVRQKAQLYSSVNSGGQGCIRFSRRCYQLRGLNERILCVDFAWRRSQVASRATATSFKSSDKPIAFGLAPFPLIIALIECNSSMPVAADCGNMCHLVSLRHPIRNCALLCHKRHTDTSEQHDPSRQE